MNKSKIIELIEGRIAKLMTDKKVVPYRVDNERRIHPAWKQINGRIKELQFIRKRIEKLKW